MRPQWMLLVTSFVCFLLLAACGQGNGTTTNPATATTAPVAPNPTSAASSRGAATATTAPARQAGPRPTAASITLGKPVVVPSDEGEVVVVTVANTADNYVSFILSANAKGSKIGSQPFFSVTRMPAGATWSVAMIAN